MRAEQRTNPARHTICKVTTRKEMDPLSNNIYWASRTQLDLLTGTSQKWTGIKEGEEEMTKVLKSKLLEVVRQAKE